MSVNKLNREKYIEERKHQMKQLFKISPINEIDERILNKFMLNKSKQSHLNQSLINFKSKEL